ncbi:PREDICTED: probable carboxylesterase 2 [Nicotiana attenuata]|uniref:Carboxylesterase 2 n=1 Tax=Nicotiana attenuata TaxID=49451 RepID=A0A1J6J663_NICAT|nr:PREDICTED: probable carboxylesterase 2 [Nicotiana attenuata]XP_019244142.1 PREDICTED: probable carboxylesterase 2 [Nicotiana attenuata]OIT05319.1 putative carboxylesterase 2 [Nicotiana attenuata]
MASNTKEIAVDMTPFFVIYKDGTINRFRPSENAPLCDDPQAPVQSKDVVIQPETGVSVRLYLPKLTNPQQKIPLVIYIHGGAFCIGSARSPTFHNFISSLVEKSNFIAVSVDYRLAPENPLSTTYDDSWSAFQWVLSHVNGKGPESWLNEYADFGKVFIGGESAGANIANDVAVRAGVSDLDLKVKILGLYLVHPYFGVENDTLYKVLCPTNTGGCFEDPRVNPLLDPRLKSMACKKVLFLVAEKDFLKEGTMNYYEGLKKSEWNGEVEIMETKGEGHCFHFFNPMSEKAVALMDKLVDFLKQD